MGRDIAIDRFATMRVEAQLDATARRRPRHVALIYRQRCWTYTQLCAESARRAAILVDAGLQPGDIIATAEAATDDLYLAFLACCRADLIFFPILSLYPSPEVQDLVRRSETTIMLTHDGGAHPAVPSLRSLPIALFGDPTTDAQREAQRRSTTGGIESIAYIQTTSGTAGGTPKLALIPHRALTWPQAHRARWRTWWYQDHHVVYQPSTIIFDRDVCETFGMGGTTILAHSRHVGQHEATMAMHRDTTFVPVPSLLRSLVEQHRPPPVDLHLQAIRTTASPLTPTLITKTRQRYAATIINEYASSEGGAMLATPRDGTPEGGIGKPYPGVLARIVDESGRDVAKGAVGELIVRSPCLMSGYVNDPIATAQSLRAGWLWTGDLARLDEYGHHFLEGRRALRINVGGFKVAPEEVEAVLEQHPGVFEAAVTAMPDATRGEVVRAVIVPRGSPPTISELQHFCRKRLARYKVPRQFEFREELPRAALGKVLRQKLIAQ